MRAPTVEAGLVGLQRVARRAAPVATEPVRTSQVPVELTGGEVQYLSLTADEAPAADRVAQALPHDLRFEHIRDPWDVVWDFVCRCWLDKTTDHVPAFVQRHGREVVGSICYIPIEFLTVAREVEVLGMQLLPVDDSRVPAPGPERPWFKLDPPVGCVAAVSTTGTSPERMAERARAEAAHGLRRLRVALREHRAIHDRQLRFQLAITFAFETGEMGWRQRNDVAYDLELNADGVELAASQPVAWMPREPSTDVDKKADLALRWMERAWFAGDPLTALLFLFFALEALLGDKAEGQKAHLLAFRQTMLSHIITEGFTHPNQTWLLYDKVRSGAVHGEDIPEVDWDTVHSFAWVVRRALNQYLTFARQHKLIRRGRLLKLLDEHPDRPKLIGWLRQGGGPVWRDYLDRIENAEPIG